jgi:ABC-type proline/glycine betaine transport system ATPase subunit
MPRVRGNVEKRNIVLKIVTYNRLEKFLIELMGKRGSSKITFDDAINALLDEHEGKVKKVERDKTGELGRCSSRNEI